MQDYDIKTISSNDSQFLNDFNHIDKPFKCYYAIGNENLINQAPRLAIIGTRKPTTYGKQATYELSYEAARAGAVIVSGLAHGVDAIAHQAALQAGGKCIAILPNSLNTIYPAVHYNLARAIVANGGLLISEYRQPVATKPYIFVQRNRIIAAIADYIMVTEATAKSGVRHTIDAGMKLGKPLLMIPGNINSHTSVLPNQFIRDGLANGVEIITSLEDLLSRMGIYEKFINDFVVTQNTKLL